MAARKTGAPATNPDPEPQPAASGRDADRLAELDLQAEIRDAVRRAQLEELPLIGGGHGGSGSADIAGVAGS